MLSRNSEGMVQEREERSLRPERAPSARAVEDRSAPVPEI